MTIGAGKSDGRLATTRDSASIPPADEPMTTSCGSAAAFFPTMPHSRPPRTGSGAGRLVRACTRAGFHPRGSQTRAYVRPRRARVCGISSSPQSAEATSGSRHSRSGDPRLRSPTNGSAPAGPFVQSGPGNRRGPEPGTEAARHVALRRGQKQVAMSPRSIRDFILTGDEARAACSAADQVGRPSALPSRGDGVPAMCKPLAAGEQHQMARGFIAPHGRAPPH